MKKSTIKGFEYSEALARGLCMVEGEGEGDAGGGSGDGEANGEGDGEGEGEGSALGSASSGEGEGEGKKAEGEGEGGDKGDGEGKKGDGEGSTVPETYEIKKPDDEAFKDMEIDAKAVELLTPDLKEAGITQEQVDKLTPALFKLRQQWATEDQAADVRAVTEQRKEWLDAAKADEEVGGQNWDKTLATAARGLDALGYGKGSEMRQFLDESGLGNHVLFVKLFNKIGQMDGEDGFVRTQLAAQNTLSTAEKFYGAGYGSKGS